MIRPCCLSFLLVLCSLTSTAQRPDGSISNVRTEMKNRALIIRYDLAGDAPSGDYQVALTVVDNRGHAIHPDSVYGDLGPGITPGTDKTIVWEVYKEYDVIYGSFTPRLTLDPGTARKQAHGPAYAGLSLLVPGLGDYFVADPSSMKIKPWYKTAFTAGVLALSWTALQHRAEIPPVMMPPGYYISADVPPGAENPYMYIDHEWMAEPAYTDYWMFPYDAEIILGVGVASWLFDVIWVARKGVVNNRVQRSVMEHLSLLPCGDGLRLCFTYEF